MLKIQGLIEIEICKIIDKYDAIICGDDEITEKVINLCPIDFLIN